jgi:hypothetical protein
MLGRSDAASPSVGFEQAATVHSLLHCMARETTNVFKNPFISMILTLSCLVVSTSSADAGKHLSGHGKGHGCNSCETGRVGKHHNWHSSFHSAYQSGGCCGAAATCCGGLTSVAGVMAVQNTGGFISGYEGLPDMDGHGVHYRYPYHSYRRPWFHPGPPSTNVTIVW